MGALCGMTSLFFEKLNSYYAKTKNLFLLLFWCSVHPCGRLTLCNSRILHANYASIFTLAFGVNLLERNSGDCSWNWLTAPCVEKESGDWGNTFVNCRISCKHLFGIQRSSFGGIRNKPNGSLVDSFSHSSIVDRNSLVAIERLA